MLIYLITYNLHINTEKVSGTNLILVKVIHVEKERTIQAFKGIIRALI